MGKFRSVMHRGHKKVKFSPRKGRLLMTFSNEQHRVIAQLIQSWLQSDLTPAQQNATNPGENKKKR